MSQYTMDIYWKIKLNIKDEKHDSWSKEHFFVFFKNCMSDIRTVNVWGGLYSKYKTSYATVY